MKVNMSMIKSVVMEYIDGVMGICIRVTSLMI